MNDEPREDDPAGLPPDEDDAVHEADDGDVTAEDTETPDDATEAA